MTYVERGRLVFPPDPLHRAYLNLVYQSFLLIRSSERLGSEQGAFSTELADAMHNVVDLITHYDEGWLNDEKFRKMYLRPFDERWRGRRGIVSLEGILDQFLEDLNRSTGERDQTRD
jgi:hypothetical protein